MTARRNQGRSALQVFGGRIVFAVSLLVFLVLGIILVGDFAAQWWLLILPLALLVQPVLRVARDRRRPTDEGQHSSDFS